MHSSDSIIAAVTYSEGGASSDAVSYSVDRALNGGLLTMLYVEDSSVDKATGRRVGSLPTTSTA